MDNNFTTNTLDSKGQNIGSNRRKLRPFWITGAALMAIVVIKLFLIELSNSGGIARIASFIIVGVLLLLVGWFAPVPPKAVENEEDKA